MTTTEVRTVRRVALLATAGALAFAGCTSSSSADDIQPVVTVPAEVTETTDTFDVGTVADQAVPTAMAERLLPDVRVLSDGGSVIELSGDSYFPIAEHGALEIGQSPQDAERFASIDVGAGRTVAVVVHIADEAPRVDLVANGQRRQIGLGDHPVLDDESRWLARAVDNSVVLTDLEGAELHRLDLDGAIIDMADGAGGNILVLHEVGRSVSLTVVAVTDGVAVSQSSSSVASGAQIVAAVDADHFAIATVDEARSVVQIVMSDTGAVTNAAVIEMALVDLDFSADGTVGIAVAVDGSTHWVIDSSAGPIDGPWTASARW